MVRLGDWLVVMIMVGVTGPIVPMNMTILNPAISNLAIRE